MNQKVISLVTIAPRFLLLIWFFICGGIVSAQSVYVNQDLSILKNTSFYIGGYLSVGKRANVVNNGQLFIRDSIVNKRANLFFESSNPYKDNGGVPTASGASQGAVVFFGGKEQSIKALPGDTMLFSTLRVVNNSKLIFKSPGIVVLDSVKLEKGNIDLQLQNLDLFYPGTYRRSSGFIYGEDNRNNIYDSKYRTDTAAFDRFSGLVRGLFESSSSASEVARLKSMGIVFNDFSSVYSNRGHVSSPNAGDGSIRKSFLVTPANGGARIEDGMNFTYLDTADLSGLNINESKLGLFKKESTSAITFYNIGGKLNALSNEVQFSSPAFGLWTLAESNCKNPPRVVFTASKINVCQNSPFLLEGKLVSDSVSATKIYSWYRTIGTDSDTLSFTGLSIRDSLKTSDTAIYMVKVVDNRGCYSFSEVEVIPHLLPKASIHGIKTGGYCLGESVVLSDTAKFTDSDIVKRIWSFGADTLCRENVTYKYTSAGTKYVRLYVESNFGCSDTLTRTVVVHSLPSLNIRAKQSCAGLQTTMDVDKADSESYLSAEWDFGDSTKLFFDAGTYDNVLQTIVHPYASVGSKEISLIVKTSGGCMDTVTNQVHIHQPDVVNFSVSSHCAGTKANFTNQSTAYSGAATYYWIFGDGSAFTGYTPDKKYAAAQTYDVELKQVTPVCTTSVSLPVTVNGLPDATFDVSNGCLGQELIFSASNTSPDVAYNWNINGEAFATSEVSKRFALAGSYTATFQITDGNGCTSTSVKPFSVYNSPIVNFNVQPDCFGNPTRFYNQSSVAGGTLTYLWDFGDDNISGEKSPSYTFPDSAGNKIVKLVALSDKGCRDSISKTVEVYHIPHSSLPASISTCGNSYVADATVNSSVYKVVSYQWDKGANTPFVTITRSGYPYSVKLTTDKGCSHTQTITVTLNSVVNTHLPSDTAFCKTGVLNALYPDDNCLWEYADTKNSTPVSLGSGQFMKVTQSGTYKVSVKDQNGCFGNTSVNATVNPLPYVELGDNKSVCEGSEVILDAGTDGSSYMWNSLSGSRYLKVSRTGKYSVLVTNVFGCSSSDNVGVSFNSLPVKNLQNVEACNSAVLDAGNSGAAYLWSTGETTRKITVSSPGTYSVVITNGNQCSVSDMAYANIRLADRVDLGMDKSACEGDTVLIDAGVHASEYAYMWNGKKTNSSALPVTLKGKYVIKLINEENGCSTSDSVNVTFKAKPTVNLGNDRSLCNNTDITLDAGNENAMVQWGNSAGNTYLQQQIVVHEPGKYWVMVVNNEGCTGKDTIEIYPTPETLVAEFLSASTAYTGDSIRFVNLSYPLPYTSKWRFGDGVTSLEESPYHCFYISDTFDVTLSVTSNLCSASVTKPIRITSGFKSKKVDITNTSEIFLELLHSVIYPNPSDGNFTFEFQLSRPANVQITLFNLQGQLILNKTFKNTDLISETYSLNYLPKGVYIFSINYGNERKTYKIIKI